MKTYVQGTDLTIAVPLTRDGEPFVADNSTVAWTLHGQDGSVMTSGQLTDAADSTAYIPVTQARNTISAGRAFEKRILVLSGTVGGLPFTIRSSYQLIPWINYTVSEDDVRAFIGIGSGELPDSDIDLPSAYMDVVGYTSQETVDAALISGDVREREANRALVARAVLLVLPSLQARISKSESDGSIDVTRQDLDFADLEDRASSQLSRALDIFSPRDAVIPALVVLTDRPDIFRRCARF